MQKITPFLWFDNQAEEAMNFYLSVFKNSRVIDISRSVEGNHGVPGKVMFTRFELNGQEIMALNGGPEFSFSEAFSFFVECESQEEVDFYWDRLTADGGEESMCGWLKDKYGLSWQIIPNLLGDLMGDPDPEKANRVMQAMLKMRKIDCALLQQAYDGK